MENLQDYIERCYKNSDDEWNNEISFLEVNENDEYVAYPLMKCNHTEYTYWIGDNNIIIPGICVEYAGGSDYSGSTVEKSNYNWFEKFISEIEENDLGIYTLFGGYNSYGIFISFDEKHMKNRSEETNQALCDVLIGLENYPIIDEDLLSKLELELEDEAWENYNKSDLISELNDELDIEINEEEEETEKFESNIYDLYRYLMEKTNTYPMFETGCNCSVDISRLVNECIYEDLEKHNIKFEIKD